VGKSNATQSGNLILSNPSRFQKRLFLVVFRMSKLVMGSMGREAANVTIGSGRLPSDRIREPTAWKIEPIHNQSGLTTIENRERVASKKQTEIPHLLCDAAHGSLIPLFLRRASDRLRPCRSATQNQPGSRVGSWPN
jgi:hypothetical protein